MRVFPEVVSTADCITELTDRAIAPEDIPCAAYQHNEQACLKDFRTKTDRVFVHGGDNCCVEQKKRQNICHDAEQAEENVLQSGPEVFTGNECNKQEEKRYCK